jgi:hypothetical protein
MYWLILLLIALTLASIIAGQSHAPSTTTGSQKCDDCKKDIAWYNSLNRRKKILYSAWYATRWAICKAAGC